MRTSRLPDRSALGAWFHRRRRIWRIALLSVAGVLVMLPVLAGNALGSVDQGLFDGYDTFSKNLVLAKIESTTPGAIAQAPGRIGLLIAQPIPVAPAQTFDGLKDGGTATSNGYEPYKVQLGLQGQLFTALYHSGVTTIGGLETVNAALTAAALMGFALMLALVAPRSLAAVFLLTSIASPWLVAAARNLYWVPWSFFLPAIAAIAFVRAGTRRTRWIAAGAVLAAFALRFGMGFEFLTSIALLAAGMPLLAWAFGSTGGVSRPLHPVRDTAAVLGLGVLAFAAVFAFTCWFTNRGAFGVGLNEILQHAATRTYGGTSTDPVTALSLTISPWDVLWIYVFDWRTNLLRLGWGAPFDVVLGPHALFPLLVASVAIVLWRLTTGDRRAMRDLILLGTGVAPPLSWILLAKAHAFVHAPIDFVLWYLLGVAAPLWVVGAFGTDLVRRGASRLLGRVRTAAGPVARRAPVRAIAPARTLRAEPDRRDAQRRPVTSL